MTRYEFFEAWLTPKEWATWKKHSVARFCNLHNLRYSEGVAKRKAYLKQELTIDTSNRRQVNDEWDDMTNRYIRWADTPQGHDYWARVNGRGGVVRALPPMRAVLNNVN